MAATIRRRDFIKLLAGTAVSAGSCPDAGRAQSALPAVGILSSASARDYGPMLEAFRKSLAEGGFVEGRNVRIEYAWAEGRYDRLPALAADLLRREARLLVAASTPAAMAAKQATDTIPIVFAIGGDPERTGLVKSLNHPGGNVTGAAHINVDVAPKRLELLHELMPAETTAGLLVNQSNPLAPSVIGAVEAAARDLNLDLRSFDVQDEKDIDTVFERLSREKMRMLVVGTDPLFTSHIGALADAALRARVAAIYQYRDYVLAGGVMSYGGNITDSYTQAGRYVARILKGEKPADLPVQLSTRVELILNLKTARQLGLEVPSSLLGRADEVIE